APPPALVGPPDAGPLALGLRLDGRVRLQQPLLDLVGVLPPRVPAGLLGGVAPAAQVQADGALGQVDAAVPADQVAHGAARPQGVRDAHLLGGMQVDARLDALGLLVGQQASGAERAAGAAARQRRQAVGAVGGPPAADSLVADAQELGEFQLGVAQLEPP